MTTEIILMPETDGAGDVIEYCVEIGEQLSAGDSILVLESDKASMEVPIPIEGTLEEWLVDIGQQAETGTPLAKIRLSKDSEQESKSDKDVSELIDAVSDEVSSSDQDINKDDIAIPSGASAFIESTETVLMPETDGAGDVIEYCVEIGDQIQAGDSILVLESDKASMEVPASVSGVLEAWLVDIGQQAETGTPLAKIRTTDKGEASSAEEVRSSDAVQEKSVGITVEVLAQDGTRIENELAQDISGAVQSSTFQERASLEASVVGQRSYAGPATRKLARELGVSLGQVQGSGLKGRVLKDDVKLFVKHQLKAMPSPSVSQNPMAGSGIPKIPAQDFSLFGEIKEESLSGIAKATSAHMTRCWLNVPHVTLMDEVNISELEAYRKKIRPESIGLEKKPTILPFIVMIVAKALRRFPQFNSSLSSDGESVIYKDYVNIGIAVDTPAGLVVPVIRDADKKGIVQLTEDINLLALKAKQRKLTADDMKGGCFSISSLGATGGTGFTPIINAPEVAILGVARSEIKPVWDGGSFQPATKLPLCLSFDHRVINGADAGRFMAWIHQCLAQIENTLL
jgi:pyruvate dehydrogenase E2 component (dihydrolipoamide acetyltransferase)